jgi:uncharacterized protein involved in type VI secretion and phage assembly
MSDGRFYGKYRGKVTSNVDPHSMGRIRANVPAVFGDEESGWALPSAPYGGPGVGFFFVPPIDANVWIEFEGGNPDYPIWTGCFWGLTESPVKSMFPFEKMIRTDSATIKLDDTEGTGGITIETNSGLKIVMDMNGIELSNGTSSIKLTPASVSVNNGALEVI